MDTFDTLAPQLQKRIDDAFNIAEQETPREKQLSTDATEPSIPLSSIPSALQLLRLPPDNADVLSAFQQSASAWGDNTDSNSVSLGDWRSICAILVQNQEQEYPESDGIGPGGGFLVSSDVDMDASDDDADVFEPEDDDGSEADEYVDRPGPSSKRRTRRARAGSPESDDSTPPALTARQKQTCLTTFSLFFPACASESDLTHQKLRITEVQSAAKLLGEKLTAEDIVEMLAVFSTSPDQTMSLEDFETMMVKAGLV